MCIRDRCQMDIAAELGWRRATVGDHLKHILERVENVSAKLYTNLSLIHI